MHELDIPEFLRISQADRKEAWLTFKPRIIKDEVKRLPINASLACASLQGVKGSIEEPSSGCEARTVNHGIAQSGRNGISEPKRGRGRPKGSKNGSTKLKIDKPKSTHGNVGKAWMLNRVTGERARVDVSQVAVYEAKGFIKGGPRSN